MCYRWVFRCVILALVVLTLARRVVVPHLEGELLWRGRNGPQK